MGSWLVAPDKERYTYKNDSAPIADRRQWEIIVENECVGKKV